MQIYANRDRGQKQMSRHRGRDKENRYMDTETKTEIRIGIDIVSLSNCVGNRVIGTIRYRKETKAERDTRSCER
jgi:hypothetical protein